MNHNAFSAILKPFLMKKVSSPIMHLQNLAEITRLCRASQVAQWVKNLPAMQKTQVWSLGWDDPLEEPATSLQYSCLENPMDRGAWWVTVHKVSKSQTRLKWLSTIQLFTHSFFSNLVWSLMYFATDTLYPCILLHPDAAPDLLGMSHVVWCVHLPILLKSKCLWIPKYFWPWRFWTRD